VNQHCGLAPLPWPDRRLRGHSLPDLLQLPLPLLAAGPSPCSIMRCLPDANAPPFQLSSNALLRFFPLYSLLLSLITKRRRKRPISKAPICPLPRRSFLLHSPLSSGASPLLPRIAAFISQALSLRPNTSPHLTPFRRLVFSASSLHELFFFAHRRVFPFSARALPATLITLSRELSVTLIECLPSGGTWFSILKRKGDLNRTKEVLSKMTSSC